MAATTFRRDVRAALVAILEAQQAASPTLLRKVESSRPGGFNELPIAYVAGLDESITWTAGVRTRVIDGAEVVIVDSYREASHDGLDQLVDLLVDRFNAQTQAIGNAIIELTRVADTEIAVEGSERTTYYRAVVLSLARTAKWEGRN